MKKITSVLIIFYLTLLFSTNLKAQTEFKLDSIQQFNWNDPILPNDWLMQLREHYTYANGGTNFTNSLRLVKDNDNSMTWLESFQQIRTFNVNDKLESEIFQFYNGSSWTNLSKSDYNYDGNGDNDLITYSNHNGSNWFITGQDLMTYNGSHLVLETTSQFYNSGTMMFDNVSQYRNTYTGDLLMQNDLYQWDILLDNWEATPSNSFVYSYNGMLVSTITGLTDNGSGLENNSLTTYTYNGNNIETILNQIYNGSSWDDQSKSEFTSYDVNDLPLEIISYSSIAPATWLQQYKFNYYYSEAALNVSSNELSGGKAFPNPFMSQLNITLKSPLVSAGTLSIFDIHGKEISQTDINQGVKFIEMNSQYLSNGIYFVTISNTSSSSTFKVIKQ